MARDPADPSFNVRELLVPLLMFECSPQLTDTAVCFRMDNSTAVSCVNCQGTARSDILLSVTENLFRLAETRHMTLSTQFLPGSRNQWADALSRFKDSSVEWQLTLKAFLPLTSQYGLPEVDLFASPSAHRLPRFLSRFLRTQAGGPDAFSEDWNKWNYIYLFPPPSTLVMLRVCRHLTPFSGRVLLIAP